MPTLAAHAKINLFLNILARESTGYHGIETLFCRIALADEVAVERGAAGIRLELAGGEIPGDVNDNLVYRAAILFHERIGVEPAVDIHLTKRIPIGAGLGGGSSDAAATIRALDSLHGEPLGEAARLALGAELGSDVSFFLTGADLALGWNRGERLLALPALPEAPIVLVVPAEAMATAEAYALLAERREGRPPPVARAHTLRQLTDWHRVARLASNDFEEVVFRRIGVLSAVRDMLRTAGARMALLSGSGSSIFGVFDDVHARGKAAARIRDGFPGMTVIETVTTSTGHR